MAGEQVTKGRVEISGLRVGYGGDPVLSLDELTVQAGEFLSVLGPSGCGKSALLSAIAGFVTPDAGTIGIDGGDITAGPPNRRGNGPGVQHHPLFPHQTVRGNLANRPAAPR